MLITILEAHATRPENCNLSPISSIEADDNNADLKPAIDSISDVIYHFNKYDFNVEFTVYFHGTNRIHVELEEEFDCFFRSYYYDGPGKVHVKT